MIPISLLCRAGGRMERKAACARGGVTLWLAGGDLGGVLGRPVVGGHTGQASSCSAGLSGSSFLSNSHFFPFQIWFPLKRNVFSSLPLSLSSQNGRICSSSRHPLIQTKEGGRQTGPAAARGSSLHPGLALTPAFLPDGKFGFRLPL